MKGVNKNIKYISAEDDRQFMINDNLEIYEKSGVPTGAEALHYHNFYEIIYMVEGEFCSLVENETFYLKKGDFLCIPQNAMHRYNYIEAKHENSKRIIMWISEELLINLSMQTIETDSTKSTSCASAYIQDFRECFLGQNFNNKPDNRRARAYHFPMYYEELLRGFLMHMAIQEDQDSDFYAVKNNLDRGYLLLFFSYFSVLCSKKEYNFRQDQQDINALVDKVSTFIDMNIDQPITVDELANHVHMSKYYFLRKFKELTGVTVHNFINQKRLIKACEAITQGLSVEEAYIATGFSDYSVFSRNFKKIYGVAPSRYKDYYIN